MDKTKVLGIFLPTTKTFYYLDTNGMRTMTALQKVQTTLSAKGLVNLTDPEFTLRPMTLKEAEALEAKIEVIYDTKMARLVAEDKQKTAKPEVTKLSWGKKKEE